MSKHSIQHLEQILLQKQTLIEDWLRQQWRKTPPPFYSSVDLRNAGFKLAPVDTNLFPGGFNNLSADALPLSIQAAQTTLEQRYSGCRRLLLIPENHTRNTFYFENIAILCCILKAAGYEVRIGSLREDLTHPEEMLLPSGKKIVIEPVMRTENRLHTADFSACLLLLNNDLSSGIPKILQNLDQPMFPSTQLGWSTRRKSTHFGHYHNVCQEFAQLIDIDPWLIDPLFLSCEKVDFMKREGEAELQDKVALLLSNIQKKYDEYGITHKPFVVVKADAGTYGMGIMMVQDAAELAQLNRKQRTQMTASKGQPVHEVIIQEGVYTFETHGTPPATAEPVIYMIGQHVIGGFYRIHTKKGVNENLNAPGMHFEPLPFEKPCNHPDHTLDPDCEQNRFYAYGVIARLALVAAARESL